MAIFSEFYAIFTHDPARFWIWRPCLHFDPRLFTWTILISLVIRILMKMSLKKCCVSNCNKTREDSTTLHLFPNPDKDPIRFLTWINAVGGDIVSMDHERIFKTRRVCHLHFEQRYHTRSKRLSANAVPTLGLSGFSIVTNQQPLQDVTNSLPAYGEEAPSISRQYTTELNIEQVSTFATQPTKSPTFSGNIKFCSEELNILVKKLKKLRSTKESTMAKLKKALKLSQNSAFQKAISKFTAAALIFTMLQFRESGKHKMGRRFKKEEKVMALALYKQGPKAYRWMSKFFVLPSPVTLSRMISTASLKAGINENLFQLLEKKIKKMHNLDKLCLLIFDEIALTPHFQYNHRCDTISGFVNYGKTRQSKIADHALVFLLRGVHKNYKQPLGYSFCAGTTPKEVLAAQIKQYIEKLNTIGFVVVATVCDQGATNVSAINLLISETRQKYFKINKEQRRNTFEVNNKEIVPLYDPPHLIKGIRNNLLKKNLKFSIDGQQCVAKWDHIIMLYNENPSYMGLRLLPKLTENHVIPQKIFKMKVKCATQVFSKTVGLNMGYLASKGLLPAECEDTAKLLIFFDDLFDSLNGSYQNYKKRSGKALLGPVTPSSAHKKIWTESKRILKMMKFTQNNCDNTVPSIKNFIFTIENIEYLCEKLHKNYNLSSIWMRHFNQDTLENFFGSIRSHGYRNTSPSCAGFEIAFVALLINNLNSLHSPGANCEADTCRGFKTLNKLFFEKTNSTNKTTEVDYDDLNNNIIIDYKIKLANVKCKAQIEYVTGYVLHKLKSKIFKNCKTCITCLHSKESGGSAIISTREYNKNKRSLTYPSQNLIECFSNMQDIIIHVIRKDAQKYNIKCYLKTILSIIINYDFINCNQHKGEIINMMENLCITLFLCNWCKDTNKLLNGRRSDFDLEDNVQKLAVEYCKKRRK